MLHGVRLRRDVWRFASAAGFTGLTDFFVALFQFVQLFVGKLLDIDKIVIGWMVRAGQLIQLQVQRLGITILGVLNEKDHKKRNDSSACVDDELPSVRKMKERPAHGP